MTPRVGGQPLTKMANKSDFSSGGFEAEAHYASAWEKHTSH